MIHSFRWLGLALCLCLPYAATAQDKPAAAAAKPAAAAMPSIDIAKTVVQMPLKDGVKPEDAIDSMKLRANNINFKLVAHQPLSKELESMGVKARRMEIFQFCDPRIANDMVNHNLAFAAYLPCRIALVEDPKGKFHLMTLNLDPFIASSGLQGDLLKKAMQVRDAIGSIMQAGASGDL